MSEEEVKALVEMKDMLKAENTKLKQKLEEQTKTYKKILQEQQNEIDQLERNCDVFNEQMNDAVERATELQQEKEELIKKPKVIVQNKLKEITEEYHKLDKKNLNTVNIITHQYNSMRTVLEEILNEIEEDGDINVKD